MRLAASIVCLSLLAPAAAVAGDLKVTVTGISSAQGEVLGALYDSEANFLKPPAAKAKFKLKAQAGQLTYVIHNLGAGRYAMTAFHDANDNGKLDRNGYGVPTEGYGFSNDAQGSGGPPKFGQAAFDFDGKARSITVALDYP